MNLSKSEDKYSFLDSWFLIRTNSLYALSVGFSTGKP